MNNIFLKLIGALSLICGILFLGTIFYVSFFSDATIITRPMIRMIVFAFTVLMSGIGILSLTEKIFYFSFYACTFFILDKVLYIYHIVSAKKVGFDLLELNNAISQSILNSSILIAVFVAMLIFLLSTKTLQQLNISSKKRAYQNILLSLVLFVGGSFFLY